ncbi:MAG: putative DNA-binding domain-containing protein [Gammaproteobacteria bacterium]
MTSSASKTRLPRFMQQQYAFAAHIRNPLENPRPEDVAAPRMAVYNELFYNNVEDFMASSFPVLRSLLTDESWHALIRDYFARHRAHTPLFPEMPREFLKYLENERPPQPDDYPFLFELAHYEWVELALTLLDVDLDAIPVDTNGDLRQGIPVLSPLAWPLQYHYPVQTIGPETIPEAATEGGTFLLVYRDREDQIHFMDLNPVTARLLQVIQTEPGLSGESILGGIAAELQHPNPAVVIEGGLQILYDLQLRGVILGTRALIP